MFDVCLQAVTAEEERGCAQPPVIGPVGGEMPTLSGGLGGANRRRMRGFSYCLLFYTVFMGCTLYQLNHVFRDFILQVE